jgi:deazaflavin-dependent oxidoreductase (nitroreductase family)
LKAPRLFWKLTQVGPRIAYALGLGPLLGRFVLLLGTTGRKSRRVRVTPLVYEELEGNFLVASARGASADWFRNVQANPNVKVRAGRRAFDGRAEVKTDLGRIADYLQRQMERNPKMFGTILRSEGLSVQPTRAQLESLAAKRPMVAIRPTGPS